MSTMMSPMTPPLLPTPFDELRRGRLPATMATMLSPFSVDEHERHVVALAEDGGRSPVHGLEIDTPPGLYRPHAASSSQFILRTLLRERPRLGRLLELGCGTGGLAARAQVRQGDLFAPVAGPAPQRFDSVLFNLPLMHADHGGRRHPALDDTAGQLAWRFFEQLPAHLAPQGRAFFSYANISDPAPLEALGEQMAVELLAAEWVARSGFWLFVYEARPKRPQ